MWREASRIRGLGALPLMVELANFICCLEQLKRANAVRGLAHGRLDRARARGMRLAPGETVSPITSSNHESSNACLPRDRAFRKTAREHRVSRNYGIGTPRRFATIWPARAQPFLAGCGDRANGLRRGAPFKTRFVLARRQRDGRGDGRRVLGQGAAALSAFGRRWSARSVREPSRVSQRAAKARQ